MSSNRVNWELQGFRLFFEPDRGGVNCHSTSRSHIPTITLNFSRPGVINQHQAEAAAQQIYGVKAIATDRQVQISTTQKVDTTAEGIELAGVFVENLIAVLAKPAPRRPAQSDNAAPPSAEELRAERRQRARDRVALKRVTANRLATAANYM